eukprot:COSAG05_NODE_11605_length_505_cov_1.263547_1_plen_58_part_00
MRALPTWGPMADIALRFVCAGPLRIVPGSHLTPLSLSPEEAGRPHPEEQLLYLRAGR